MDKRLKFHISTGAIISGAALLLLLPLKWVVAMVIAAAVHEISHMLAVLITGGKIRKMCIGGRGMVMEIRSMSATHEIICAIAGPIGSFLLIAVAPRFPRIAVCGIVHGLYNLLPLFPMDGGRVLRCVFYALFSPPLAQKLLSWVQWIAVAVICVGCILLASVAGILPILFAMLILGNNIKENPLAKMPLWRYNRGTIHEEVRP